ncbi:MAG: hypothetical protein DMG14_33365 [Acidobacteria bacterium]|nr:MAG: hypothetical protein DMG14_33365 [Acidobacteriota bacterium]
MNLLTTAWYGQRLDPRGIIVRINLDKWSNGANPWAYVGGSTTPRAERRIFLRMIKARRAGILIVLLASASLALVAQTRTTVERYVGQHQQEILSELVSLLSIPNVASDKPNIRKNAELLREMLSRRGFVAEILETNVNPLVYGELRVPGASRTILWYAHYDGQPFDARLWKQESAFKPILRDGRMEDGAKEIASFTSLKTYPSRLRALCLR